MAKSTRKNRVHKSESSKILSQVVCSLSFIIGLWLAVLMINIYRQTVISWQIPFCISISSGITLAFITRRSKFNIHNFPTESIFYPIFYYITSLGSFLGYLFLAYNYYFAYPEIAHYDFPIKEKSSMPGPKGHRDERQPLVRFDYFGREKELVFPYSQTSQVAQANKILIRVKKGRLGFDIVDSRELL